MADSTLVGQLCRLYAGGKDDPVALVRVFVDEAGIHDDARILTVAAYVARPTGWQKFTKEWNRILIPSGIECYHATDAQALQGEFDGWDATERDELVVQLLPIIPRYAAGVAISLHMEAYREAFKGREHLSRLLGTPYGVCFQWLVERIIKMAKGTRGRFAFVHEINHFKEDALSAFSYLKTKDAEGRLRGLTFETCKEFPPLQAADILAYECGKRLNNPIGPGRRPWAVLNPKGNEVHFSYFDAENMPKLVGILEKASASLERNAPEERPA